MAFDGIQFLFYVLPYYYHKGLVMTATEYEDAVINYLGEVCYSMMLENVQKN